MAFDLLYSEWFFMWSSDYVLVEWNWDIRVGLLVEWIVLPSVSVGILCHTLNVLGLRVVSLGRVSRSGL